MSFKNGETKKEYRLGWPKILGIIGLIVVLIIIICILYPKKKVETYTDQTYIQNINLMKEAGFEFFKGNNLPTELGAANRLSLKDMINSNLIIEFRDENNKVCYEDDSYIQAFKISDSEYDMKVFLSCETKSDYITTTIYEEKCPDCNIEQNPNVDQKPEENKPNNNTTVNKPENKPSSGSTTSSTTVNKVYNITYVNNCKDGGYGCENTVYYSVVFNTNGGNYISPQVVKKGNTATYVTPYRDGYRFLGWTLDNKDYSFSTPVTRKITLVAKWEKIETNKPVKKYTVSFNTDGGSKVSSQSVIEGDFAYRPSSPTKKCYEFVGWYTSDGRIFNFNNAIYKDITLYAHYEDDGSCREEETYTYRVTYVYNNGEKDYSKYVDEGDRLREPNHPKKDGYTFDAWYYYDARGNYRQYNFNDRIYNNLTLYAEYSRESGYYSRYCKVASKDYYSIGYTSTSNVPTTMSWTIQFDNIRAQDLKVSYATYVGASSYQIAYNQFYNKQMSMVGGNSRYQVYPTSASMLQTHSLKSNNFTERVNQAYNKNGYWYVDVTATVKNADYVTPYYAYNINNYIYFIPYQITVEYTDLNDCVEDLHSKRNQSQYKNYRIVDSFYQ